MEELRATDCLNSLRKEALENGSWYYFKYQAKIYDPLNSKYEKVTGKKYISLGRSLYYASFAKQMSIRLNSASYLLDYMLWVEPSNPYLSLLFYINSSERIDINLKGLSLEDLKKCTIEANGVARNREDLNTRQMTCWEINQIFHDEELIRKAYWHTNSLGLESAQLRSILESRVDMTRILCN